MLGQQLPRSACSSGACPHQARPAIWRAGRHRRSVNRRLGHAARASGANSTSGLDGEPSTSGRDMDIDTRLEQAKEDLRRQWASLRAGTLSSTGPGRPDGTGGSLPERLLGLVTGQSLVSDEGMQGQPLQQQRRQRQQEWQRQQSLEALEASTTSGSTGELEQQPEGQQQLSQQLQQQQEEEEELQEGEEELQEGEEEEEEGKEDGQAVWLTTTYMLVAATWLAFLAQWWSLLPDMAAAVLGGKGMLVLPQFFTVYPDTPATHLLQLDVLALLNGQGLGKLLTSSLLHSGFAAVLMCTDGLSNVGSWLEPRIGSLQLLAAFLAATLGSCAGQLLFGRAPVGISGSGACVGMYAAWAVTALTRFKGDMPVSSDRGLVWVMLNVVLALYQPAIGLPSVIGGAVGGALGALCAAALGQGLGLALGLPVMAVLVGAKVVLEALRLVLTVALTFVVATWRAGQEAVRAVRNL